MDLGKDTGHYVSVPSGGMHISHVVTSRRRRRQLRSCYTLAAEHDPEDQNHQGSKTDKREI